MFFSVTSRFASGWTTELRGGEVFFLVEQPINNGATIIMFASATQNETVFIYYNDKFCFAPLNKTNRLKQRKISQFRILLVKGRGEVVL